MQPFPEGRAALGEAVAPGVLTVDVQWGAEQALHRAAVSFAHLMDAEGRYAAGWDGLTEGRAVEDERAGGDMGHRTHPRSPSTR